MPNKADVEGEEETYRGLDDCERAAFKALVRAIKDVSLDLSGRAAKITPHDEGHLEASVSGGAEVLVEDTTITAIVSAGRGVSAPYAAYQHNTTGLKHSKPGRVDHFLSTPLEENIKRYEEMCIKAVADALRG